jgi:hypothetical protein
MSDGLCGGFGVGPPLIDFASGSAIRRTSLNLLSALSVYAIIVG